MMRHTLFSIALSLFALGQRVHAQSISLGSASSFSALAGTTITNTGPTIIHGDIGVSPGTAITGFPPGIVLNGTIFSGSANATQAQAATLTAYNNILGLPATINLTGQDLGGLTLTPGVYKFNSAAQLTGGLILNTLGNANAVFVFQIGKHSNDGSRIFRCHIRAGRNGRQQYLLAGGQLCNSWA